MRLIFLFALLPLACTREAVSRDTATQLNANRNFAHDSSGNITYGPNDIDQRVYGQRDPAGNIHVTTDNWFLTRADQLSCAQVALALLAQSRTGSLEVRRLADRRQSQYQQIDERLRSLALERKAPLAPQLAPGEIESYQRLASLSGEAFDRAWTAEVLRLDREEIQLWNEELQQSNDRQVSQLAFDTLPALQATQAEASATSARM